MANKVIRKLTPEEMADIKGRAKLIKIMERDVARAQREEDKADAAWRAALKGKSS